MDKEILKCLKNCTDNEWLGDLNSQKLYQLTQKLITELSALSNNKQSKINIFIVENKPLKFIAAFLACLITKVNLFLCDSNWKQTEWQQVLKLVQPDLILGDEQTKQLILQNLSIAKTSSSLTFEDRSLIMIPTGGSSGKIKFAIHTQQTLTASVQGFSQYFQTKQINSFCVLPLFHVSGIMQFLRSFLTIGKLQIYSYKNLKQGTKPQLNTTDFFISLVPTQLQFLIDRDPLWLSKFKTVLIGGAPAARSLLDRARYYNISLALTYGMTETASQIVTLKPQDFLQGNNSSGRVLPHAKIDIDRQSLNSEKIGLIKIEAASLCLGYYPQLFENRKFIPDDLGWLDASDYLYVVGRNSQKIITGGKNVFPSEIEAAILTTELVSDVCVIGLPDSYWGEVVTALYVPRRLPVDLNVIQQYLRKTLSNYKHPKHWLEVERLPRSDRGKVNYPQVKLLAIKLMSERK
ncbi:2-succinylbenzoate--CoA ligase [Myxosarcina sp. GI1]|uniref:2-succinylbenzoate--CoA ligase n=1 Tax=Myxosarcina sp. GI1 TaxID=1541065 RepID=UPI00055A0756|nr:2-succinylbenzoate--CoA ligase [Myxosarcina sp. GI1]